MQDFPGKTAIAEQGWLKAHKWLLLRRFMVLVFYAVLGGRVFCSWVCPVNLITDLAAWTRRRLNIRGATRLSRDLRSAHQ